jgi:hypothetical protein
MTTPTFFANLRDLLKLWQQIEAGKNPVWNVLIEAHTPVPAHILRRHLGNMENANARIYAMLRQLRKYNLITTTVTDEARHEINHETEGILSDLLGNVHGKYFMPEGTREQTLDTLIQQCHVIANARNVRLWWTIKQGPHMSGKAAAFARCTLSQASTALRLLERVGLAKSVSKGRFQIYSGLECRFLENAETLVAAGIIIVKD